MDESMISIIIVNYKSLKLIMGCLESISRFDMIANFEIFIVDNSNDDPQPLLEKFPFVHWIPMNYNAGFARANNKGITLSKNDLILLLNPDTLIETDAISRCLKQFKTSPYVAAGVQLLNPDRTPQISGSYFMKGGLNHLLPLPVLGKILKWMGTLLKVEKTSIMEAKGKIEVDWINGAFLMVKKHVIEKAGLLDEDFFLYSEEIEWCSRIRKHGKLCIFGDLNVIHLQGEAANEEFDSEGKGYYNLFDKKGKQIMLSNFVRIRKQFGVGWFLFHVFVYLIEIPFFFLRILIQPLISSKINYRLSQLTGYCNNFAYLLEKSVTIARNKPYFYKAL
jgi:GT2 family glycosyltransferase